MADDRDTKQPTRMSDDGHDQSSHTSGLFEEDKTSKKTLEEIEVAKLR